MDSERYLVDLSVPARLKAWAAVIGVSERQLASAAERVQKRRRFAELRRQATIAAASPSVSPLPLRSTPETSPARCRRTSC